MFPEELDTLSEESYKDSTLIMQLLRDNLVNRPTISFLYCLIALICVRLFGLPPRPSQAVARAAPRQRKPKRRATQLLQRHLLSQKKVRNRCSSHYVGSNSCIVGTRGRLKNGRAVISGQTSFLTPFLGPAASSSSAPAYPFSLCSRSIRAMARRSCGYSFGGHCDMRSLWSDFASLKNRTQHTRYMLNVHLSAIVISTFVI